MLVNLYRRVGFSFSKNLAVLNTKTFTTGVNGGNISKESLNNEDLKKEELEKYFFTSGQNVTPKLSQDTEDTKELPKPWIIKGKSVPTYIQFILERIPSHLTTYKKKHCTPRFLKKHAASIATEFSSLTRAEMREYFNKQAEISKQVGKSRRILTGYNIFQQENVKKVRESLLQNPNYNGDIGGDSFVEVAKKWTSLTVEEKNVYNMRAIERAKIINQPKGRLLVGRTPGLIREEII
uniref:Uncharacterized protein n=1 Tax=Polytomella parva TaxID=51329 RepID=A0A7S0YEU9_9CHLO|mmetsp:Transcript_2268/g.3439  ORF Transcript_2268/g.3439 Transcript_2268/m.3439 type:complete len:237 (+) Transcript_2268:62-772(+)